MEEKLRAFAELVQRDMTEWYTRSYPQTPPEAMARACEVRVKPGAKYTKVDVGDSGKYMVDADGNIYGIKAYGVIHRGHHYGTLDTIQEWYWGGYVGVRKALTPRGWEVAS